MNQKIINIVGRRNSGKTTLAEKLISYFVLKGYSVAVFKTTHHEFEMDRPGKDSYRFIEAGASASAVANKNRLGIVMELAEGSDPIEYIKNFFSDYDILIVEGHKFGSLPKIEVIGESPESSLYLSGVENIRFLVSDQEIKSSLPVYKRDDFESIAEAVKMEFFG